MIAFFDYPDVFEDFYPHYGVTQRMFATQWDASGNHAFLSLIQREIGDIIWYEFSIKPELDEAVHQKVGCKIKFVHSSWWHRQLWKLFYLPKPAWRWRFVYPWYAIIASYLAPLSVPFLREIWRARPDFLFLQDYSSGKYDVLAACARVVGTPFVAYHSGSTIDSYHGLLLRRWTLRWAHKIIASGANELELLVDRFGVSRNCLAVIQTPIDTTLYRPINREIACHAAGLDPNRRYLLFVGRLDDAVKRVSSIIQAFSRASHQDLTTELIIIGDGKDKEKLAFLAADHAPGRIRFMGWIESAERKAQFYASAECLVLASWREGFPTVIGEAMACGTPVLSTRVGAVEDLVVDGVTGWLCPAGDDEALHAALAVIISRPQLAVAMRPRVRVMAEERISPARVAANLKTCFANKSRWQ